MKKLRFFVLIAAIVFASVLSACSNPAANDAINNFLGDGIKSGDAGKVNITFNSNKEVGTGLYEFVDPAPAGLTNDDLNNGLNNGAYRIQKDESGDFVMVIPGVVPQPTGEYKDAEGNIYTQGEVTNAGNGNYYVTQPDGTFQQVWDGIKYEDAGHNLYTSSQVKTDDGTNYYVLIDSGSTQSVWDGINYEDAGHNLYTSSQVKTDDGTNYYVLIDSGSTQSVWDGINYEDAGHNLYTGSQVKTDDGTNYYVLKGNGTFKQVIKGYTYKDGSTVTGTVEGDEATGFYVVEKEGWVVADINSLTVPTGGSGSSLLTFSYKGTATPYTLTVKKSSNGNSTVTVSDLVNISNIRYSATPSGLPAEWAVVTPDGNDKKPTEYSFGSGTIIYFYAELYNNGTWQIAVNPVWGNSDEENTDPVPVFKHMVNEPIMDHVAVFKHMINEPIMDHITVTKHMVNGAPNMKEIAVEPIFNYPDTDPVRAGVKEQTTIEKELSKTQTLELNGITVGSVDLNVNEESGGNGTITLTFKINEQLLNLFKPEVSYAHSGVKDHVFNTDEFITVEDFTSTFNYTPGEDVYIEVHYDFL